RPPRSTLFPYTTLFRSLSPAEAVKFTKRETDTFLKRCPDYYACPENSKLLLEYLVAQGVDAFVDADTMEAAFRRLSSYNLLVEKPAPPPPPDHAEGTDVPKPSKSRREVKPEQPQMVTGRDPESGMLRQYTIRQVEAMPADVYRRTFCDLEEGLSATDLILGKRNW